MIKTEIGFVVKHKKKYWGKIDEKEFNYGWTDMDKAIVSDNEDAKIPTDIGYHPTIDDVKELRKGKLIKIKRTTITTIETLLI